MYDRLDSHNLDIAQLAQRDVLLGEGPTEKRQEIQYNEKDFMTSPL